MLEKLCRYYGIEPEWTDIWGKRHVVPPETKQALLAAMHVPVRDEAEIAAALQACEARLWRRRLAPVQVVRAGAAPFTIELTLPRSEANYDLRWTLALEDGGRVTGEVRPAALPVHAQQECDGTTCTRYGFRLPKTPPLGYHCFELALPADAGEATERLTLIVAPDFCYQPAGLAEQGKVWGPAVQLYALRSRRNWGIGDFTDLRFLVERFAESGAGVIGLNPLHALFPHNPAHASPYSPSSRLFLNVLYIDIEAVAEFSGCEGAQQTVYARGFQQRLTELRDAELVDYVAVAEAKLSALELLYQCFRAQHLNPETDRGRAFRAFQDEGAEALFRHALYEALQEYFHRLDANVWGWPVWPADYQDPESAAVTAFAESHRERIEFFEYLQWQADRQLASVGRRSLELGLGVGLYGDLAVAVDRAGAEAWANRELYAQGATIGAPPDDFNLHGQDWGLPPMIPYRLREAAYAPFIATLRANMRHAGALRIDHVMGLMRLFWVPGNANAREGAYVRYPFADLLGILALESWRSRCLVIGEDLGTVPDEVRAAMKEMHILSYRLLYFTKDPQDDFKPPADYPEQSLVAVSTHDLPTLAGYWKGLDLHERAELKLFPSDELRQQQTLGRAQDRTRLLVALEREHLLPAGVTVDPASSPEMTPELVRAVHLYIARAPSKIMMLQLEDVAGQLEQVNLPGTTDERPNWRRRLALNLEDLVDDPRMRALTGSLREVRGLGAAPPRAEEGARPPAEAIPRATYRLQFNRDFTFARAEGIVPYLARLGISHCYASPYLKARPGSAHGYDIVDHNALNPEIGTSEDHDRLAGALREHGMGQILDIVPNHMGIGGDNSWWVDVLENGPASTYSEFFDIDWEPFKEELRGKVLLPVLGDHYGKVLEAGELKLVFNAGRGEFCVHYHDQRFPIDPQTCPEVLAYDAARLQAVLGADDSRYLGYQSLVTAFRNLPARTETGAEKIAERARDKEIHKRSLADQCAASSDICRHIEENVGQFNGEAGGRESATLLHPLLEAQAYRLAYWRVAADEINYRRFFDINDLAGLRMENPQVFFATHRLITDLVARGKVHGLRIDHPDGLYDPVKYYAALQEHVAGALTGRENRGTGMPEPMLYVVAEKILASYERLPEDWPINGTTGYEFANLISGWLVYGPAERAMQRIYQRFIAEHLDFDELLYHRKKLIMRVSLSSELNVLANRINRLSESDPHTRDFTLTALRDALMEVVACFPVYRTYVTGERVTTEDRRYVDWAIAQAKKRSPAADVSIFDFIRDVLLLENLRDKPEPYRRAATEFAMRFQQYTAPLMAKGLEDTTFYTYNKLVSLNEVGGDPRRFGASVAAVHHANQERAQCWPHAMLCTSTHDSKRSEDVRARIGVLSEIADEWKTHLARWSRINRGKKRRLDSGDLAPSRNDEYLLYQTVIGAWPLEEIDEQGLATFRARIQAYMLKAVREAKVRTSWINPSQDYEDAVAHFVTELLSNPQRNAFLDDFLPLQRRVSRLGMFNSLSQTLLKLTAPGVPDIYQGNELWEYSLVDPDNRRPVDYARREALLKQLEADLSGGEDLPARVRALLDMPEDSRAKLYLTWKTLMLRRSYAGLFRDGGYVPLAVEGAVADHVCAYARIDGEHTAVVAATRWFARLLGDVETLPLGGGIWRDTRIGVPARPAGATYRNVLTGENLSPISREAGFEIPAAQAFARFPVALLLAEAV